MPLSLGGQVFDHTSWKMQTAIEGEMVPSGGRNLVEQSPPRFFCKVLSAPELTRAGVRSAVVSSPALAARYPSFKTTPIRWIRSTPGTLTHVRTSTPLWKLTQLQSLPRRVTLTAPNVWGSEQPRTAAPQAAARCDDPLNAGTRRPNAAFCPNRVGWAGLGL